MRKRIKKKFLGFVQLITSKKIYLSLFLFALILPVALGLVLRQEKKSASGVYIETTTKRFGECSTCHVKGITEDTWVNKADTLKNYGSSESFTVNQNTHVLMKFDLSQSLPTQTVVKKAILRLAMTGNYRGPTTDINQTFYPVLDPSSLGSWTESGATYLNRSAGVPWVSGADGNITKAYDTSSTPIGRMYVRGYLMDRFGINQRLLQVDLTNVVQGWINVPSSNTGFVINSMSPLYFFMGSSEHTNAAWRPYLEITYEGQNVDAPIQPTNIAAKHYSGQTFLTWKEIVSQKEEVGYRIYKYTQPITTENLQNAEMIEQVYQGSSYLGHAYQENPTTYPPRQPDLLTTPGLNLSLGEDSGLFVETVRDNRQYYYAVTSIVEGNENKNIVSGSNSLSSPVSETIGAPDAFYWGESGGYTYYAMWVSDFDPKNPADPYGLSNRRSNLVFFSLVLPHRQGYYINTTSRKLMSPIVDTDPLNPIKYPITLNLHSISMNMYNSNEGMSTSYLMTNPERSGGFSLGFESSQKMFLRMPDKSFKFIGSYMETNAGSEYYSGWNSNYQPIQYTTGFPKSFEMPRPFSEGKSVPYGERQIRFVTEWLQNHRNYGKNIDKNRVYATGGSLGGGGSHAFAIHNPDLVTAVDTMVGRVDINPGCCEKDYESTAYGTKEMNIPTPSGEGIYDYMDLPKYIQSHRNIDFPLFKTLHYRQDGAIYYPHIPSFYSAMEESKNSLMAFFAQGDHNGCTKISPETGSCIGWDEGFSFERFPDYETVLVPPRGGFVARSNEPYYNIFHFKTNQSYPAFTNFSKNSDPGTGDATSGDLRGAINRYQTWDTNSIVDTDTTYSINLSMHSNLPAIQRNDSGSLLDINDIETTDVTLRRLQNFAKGLPAGRRFKWQNLSLTDNSVIQQGEIVSDSDGLITIPSFQISKAGSKLTLSIMATNLPPTINSISTVRTYPNMTETVNAFVVDGSIYLWSTKSSPINSVITISPINYFNTSITANTAGTYLLMLTAKNENGSDTEDLSFYVHKLADINGDNSINFTDFSVLLSSWGTPINPMTNIVRTGTSATKVDFQDFSVLLSKWGG